MRYPIQIAVFLSAALVAAQPAWAKSLRVGKGQPFETIQAAVDAAAPGDRILVRPGTYTETVHVETDRLTFIGTKAVWDGTRGPGDTGTCLDGYGNGIVVQGFQFRAGYRHVNLEGEGITVRRCTSTGAEYVALYVEGDRARIEQCTVRGSGSDAIRVDGDSARVLRDRVLSSDGYGVYVFGSAAAVERNTLQNTASIAVYLRGNESRAVGNRVTSSYSEGIYAEGTDAVIRSNRVAHTTSTAIGVQGDGALVERNSVLGSDSNGIYVSGDDMRISRNVVSQIVDDSDAFSLSSRTDSGGGSVDRNTAVDCIEYGFYVRTRNVLFTANKAIRVGSENEGGWYVSNDGNTFVNCTASDCDSIGFSISGSGNTLRACRATSNTSCGFRISGNANVLDRCTSLGHPAEGVANNGTETDLLGGTYLGNRQDVSCDSSATWDEWKAPKFKTGGKDEHPLIN